MTRNQVSQAERRVAAASRLGVALLMLIGFSATVRADVVTDWNVITVQAVAAAGLNPQRQHRVAAMVHIAVHDAVNSVAPQYKRYAVRVRPAADASIEAAAVQAAYGVLIRLLPSQAATLDAGRSASLSRIPDGRAKEAGVAVGEAVAGQIVFLRSKDGSDVDGTYTFGSGPGEYQRTPPTFGNPAIPAWPFVTPFVLKRGDQFRTEGPPSLNSEEWAEDFNETKRLGRIDSSDRSPEQTEIALCDAEPALPLWNRVARSVAAQQNTGLVENARVFALLNLAMVDATIACWDSKYTYRFWRPVTAIPNADTDGNDLPRPTPPGHLYALPRSILSTRPVTPAPATRRPRSSPVSLARRSRSARPFRPARQVSSAATRAFRRLADEIGDSRTFIGFHFRSAVRHGANLGRQVGHWTFHRFLRALRCDR